MTKKIRFIEKLDTLSAAEKREITAFFTQHPNYENRIDWNNRCLAYQDFERVFSLAENSSRKIKRKTKDNPYLLFRNHNCEIIRQTDDFLTVVPLDWECAVFFNSFDCGGEGARWCIGESDDASQWNSYLADKNILFLVFFINKDPSFGRKAIIQYHTEKDKCALWLQDDSRVNQISLLLDISIEIIKNSAKRFLHKIARKDYIVDGSTLVKCHNLEIDIPAGVTAIGDRAFSHCKNLATITIPAGVATIGNDAFFGCENLSHITVEEKNPRFVGIDGVLFDKTENRILCYPAGKKDTCYSIPVSVTAIGHGAFSKCKSLATIHIPAGVATIGDNAFSGCINLSRITVEEKNPRFTGIDGVLFDKAENRILCYPAGKKDTYYTIPTDVTAIGDSAFSGCENLKAIYLSGKTSISERALANTPAEFFYTD
jgi:hypothetical protein